MSDYVTQTDITGQIPSTDLIAALDDTQSGTLNTSALNSIIGAASAKVDSFLAAVYVLPLNPVPQPVFDAALNIACYMIYRRTKAGKETNPFQEDYTNTMAWLKEIAESKSVGLDQAQTRAFSPALFSGEYLSTWGTSA